MAPEVWIEEEVKYIYLQPGVLQVIYSGDEDSIALHLLLKLATVLVASEATSG